MLRCTANQTRLLQKQQNRFHPYQAYAQEGSYFVKPWGVEKPVVQAQIARKSRTRIYTGNKIPKGKGHFKNGWLITDQDEKKHFVEDKDFVRPKWNKTDKFTKKHVDHEKMAVNSMFVNLLQQYPRNNRKIVYLDSHLGLTTFALNALGLNQQQLYIPNIDPKFHRDATDLLKNQAQLYHQSLFEWMRDSYQEKDQFTYDIGADYCGTFDGRQACRPKLDLETMFMKRILASSNGVLWCTFSRRGQGSVDEYLEEIDTWVRTTGEQYGYQLTLQKSGAYRKAQSIVYCFWVTI